MYLNLKEGSSGHCVRTDRTFKSKKKTNKQEQRLPFSSQRGEFSLHHHMRTFFYNLGNTNKEDDNNKKEEPNKINSTL